MARIVAINSSRINGNTVKKLNEIGEILKTKGHDFEIVHLMKMNINQCLGCENCLRGRGCAIKDDAEKVMKILSNADAIVNSSPVYMFNICGRLKTFADRTCLWFHRPALVGKPILNLITTSGSGLKDTEKYINKLAIEWGAYPSGCIKRKIGNLEKRIEEHELKGFLRDIKKGSTSFKPSMNMMILFNLQKILAQKVLKHDAEFWREKGWMDQDYYYKCKIGPVKKIAARLFYKFMFNKIKREA